MQLYRPETNPRKKLSLKSKLIIFGIIVLILAFIAGIIYLVRFSSVFKIKKIEISGLPDYSANELTADLKDFLTRQSKISNWLGNDNILIWNSGESENFLKTHPQFQEVDISKNYYSHQIDISAKEREKFGIWCAASGNPMLTESNSASSTYVASNSTTANPPSQNCFWFDNQGVIFSPAPVIQSELFYRVNDLTNRTLNLGDSILPDGEFSNLSKIFDLLSREEINSRTVYLKDLSLEEVDVESPSTPKIYFSLTYDPDYAATAIDALKKSGRWQKIDYVDFTVENRAYFRFK